MFIKITFINLNIINDAFIYFLQSHNVTHIFTLIGGHISPIIVAAEQLGIKVIDTRHEVLYELMFILYVSFVEFDYYKTIVLTF